ncbi:hypothetical protein [Paracoccus ravus]|uniref:hypothetical protein n=1 Tax=Paracoccus ravus TaxID=2447760 RepID=UPI00106E494F|nr:hypothetical protein [Paracoccus ravus]
MSNAALQLPSHGEAQDDTLRLIATARQRHEIRFADRKLAEVKRRAKDKPVSATQLLHWLLVRAAALGLRGVAREMLKKIASLAGTGRVVSHSLSYIGRTLSFSRQRASVLFKKLEALGLAVRVGRAIYLRLVVLEDAEVIEAEAQQNLPAKKYVNTPLRMFPKDKNPSEAPEPKSSDGWDADRESWAWATIISAEIGSLAYLTAQEYLRLSDEDALAFRS